MDTALTNALEPEVASPSFHLLLRHRVAERLGSRASDDMLCQKAHQKWLRELDEAWEADGEASGVVPVQSEEVINCLVDVAVAYVEILASTNRKDYFERRLKSSLQRGTDEASVLEMTPECPWRFDFWRGLMVPLAEEKEQKSSEVVETVRWLLASSEEDLIATANGEFPAAVADHLGSAASSDFYQDMAIFLLESQPHGAELVSTLLAERDLAGAVSARKFTPAPVKFLCHLAWPSAGSDGNQ